MKLMITGATGFLGSQLARMFLDGGHEVVILKRSQSDCRRIYDLLPRVVHFDLDRVSLSELFVGVPGVDVVIHTATCYGRQGETIPEIFNANSAVPLQLLEMAVAAGVSTCINTDTSLNKYLNPYALSKRHFAEWGRLYANQKKIRFVNLELEHFYGEGDDESKFTTHVIRSCINNRPGLDLTAGEQRRDFIHIDDVLTAYLVVMEASTKTSEYYQNYGVGSGQSVTIRSFVETVQRLTGAYTQLNFGALPYRENEVMDACADVSSLNLLGWSPQVTLEQGIVRTIATERAKGASA